MCVAGARSPKREVHVLSPLKYENGQLIPPSNIGTMQASKAVSSFDIHEGAQNERAKNNTVNEGVDRGLITEMNFFNAAEAAQVEGRRKTKIGQNFPHVIQKIMDQTQGSFVRDGGSDRYIQDFFKQDIVSSPRYRKNENAAAKLMQMRLDSRGSPMRRTFLGNIDQYMKGQQSVMDKSQGPNNSRKVSMKLAMGG